MIVVKAKKKILTCRKMIPALPKTISKASCVIAVDSSSGCLCAPVRRMTSAVEVQMRSVMKTPDIATKPCIAGSFTSAIA